MVKILLIVGTVVLAALGGYAVVTGGSRTKANRAAEEPNVADGAEETDADRSDEWTVEFVDKEKKPIKPGSARPAPLPGYVWNGPAGNSETKGAPAKSRSRARSADGLKPSSRLKRG